MKSKAIQYYTLALAVFFTLAVFSSYSGIDPSEEDNETIVLPQLVKPIDLNRSFDFAEELLPMKNPDVRQRLDKELLRNAYWHSSTILNIKNAHKYFPLIENILAKNGVPDDFKFLSVAESSLSNATSPAGAKGFWQFMKPTGQAYGLEINAEVDERYHLEKATQAACEYIKVDKKRFGSWTLAAAAYNMGGTRLAKEIKSQKMQDYYDLNLNQETSQYLFRLVAIKEILKNPRAFGFIIEEEDFYLPMDDFITVEIKTSIENLGDFANKHGISYRMLKVYNPWLLTYKLTNPKRKTYQIKLPSVKME